MTYRDKIKLMKIYEKYMTCIGPVGNIMFYIQSYKMFTTKSAENISAPAFLLCLIGLSSWLIYGILLKDKPLIIANLVGVIGAMLTLFCILIYN